MTLLRFYAIAICLLLSFGIAAAEDAPAVSATPPAATAVDPKAYALAAELIQLMNTHAVFQGVFDSMSKNMFPLIARDNPAQSEAVHKIVTDAVQKAMFAHIEQIDNNTITLYAKNYSVEELQQIVDFYKTPVGQKMLKTMPEMIQKSMALNMPVIHAVMQEAVASVTASLKKSGMKVPKEMSL